MKRIVKMKYLFSIFVLSLIVCFAFSEGVLFSQQGQNKKNATQQENKAGDNGENNDGKNAEDNEKTPEEAELESGDFVYQPRGRRDPFWDLLKGKNVKLKREEKEGIAGMLIDELELEGILLKGKKYIALFKGPDGKPYDVKVGDSVYDGEIIKIDINTVVFKRILTIALGGTKEKIITKRLTPEEEASKQ